MTFSCPRPAKAKWQYRSSSAINPIDWKLRNGQMKIVTGKAFPRAMGVDFSGVISAVGTDVTRFKAGDAVFGLARFKECGAIGLALITRETFLARKPDGISFEEAACLGTPGVTAWNGLIDKANLHAGQHVFINGCARAVGEAADQDDGACGSSAGLLAARCSAKKAESFGTAWSTYSGMSYSAMCVAPSMTNNSLGPLESAKASSL